MTRFRAAGLPTVPAGLKRRLRASCHVLLAIASCAACSTQETLNICSPPELQDAASWAAEHWAQRGYAVTADPGAGCSARILVGDYDASWGGYAYTTRHGGWILIQQSVVDEDWAPSLALLVAHETGHLLGLGHSDDPCDIMSHSGVGERWSFDCQVGRYDAPPGE